MVLSVSLDSWLEGGTCDKPTICRNDLALYLVAVVMSDWEEVPNTDRRGGASSHSLRNLRGCCKSAWTIISFKLETYTLSRINHRRLNQDVVSGDPVNTVFSMEVMESTIYEVAQDLLDMGRGPDHIYLDRLGRKWSVNSLYQQPEQSTLTKRNLGSMTSGAGHDQPFTRGFDDSDVVCSDLDRWHAHVDLFFGLDRTTQASGPFDPSMSAQVP